MRENLKALLMLVAAVLAAVLPYLTVTDHLGLTEWINVAILVAGAVYVYNSANLPGYRHAKAIAAVVASVGVLLLTVVTDGITATEWIQVVLALLAPPAVAVARNAGTRNGVFVAGPHAVERAA
jgi:uncharacterized membrane protein YqaE (UPF0057 family)